MKSARDLLTPMSNTNRGAGDICANDRWPTQTVLAVALPLGLGLPALRTVRGLKNGMEGTFELDAHRLLDPAPCRVESSRKVSSRSAGVLVELGRLGPGRGRAPGRRGVAARPAALQAVDGCEVALDTRPPKRVSRGFVGLKSLMMALLLLG
jgi:hypothetical protein